MIQDGYYKDAGGVVAYAVYGFTGNGSPPAGLTFVPFPDPGAVEVGELAPTRAVPTMAHLVAVLIAKGVITEADLDGPP